MGRLSDQLKGVLAIASAAAIWGLAPVYYGWLRDFPPADILAHRILWSFVFFTFVLWIRGRLPALTTAVTRPRTLGWIAMAAAMISCNWFFFIYAIQTGRLTESSLGYYIYPLVSVAFGYLIFGERFQRLQYIAVGLAAIGVGALTWGLGVPPWLSLILATTFSLYGVIKKRIDAGPTVSVTAEVLLFLPLVLVWLVFFARTDLLSWDMVLLLMLSGPLTGLPLVLFTQASQLVKLSTVGLISYLNPTLQFLVAALIFAEPLTRWHGLALVLIWIALGLYSLVAIRQER
ncbi:MAG: EamA family transporter RarD [Silicimonas sp.]|nr:EamA family transporter RarD [Silicimonas sp.]